MNKGFNDFFEIIDRLFNLYDDSNKKLKNIIIEISDEMIESYLNNCSWEQLRSIISLLIHQPSYNIFKPLWINTPEFKGFNFRLFDELNCIIDPKFHKLEITKTHKDEFYSVIKNKYYNDMIAQIQMDMFTTLVKIQHRINCLIETVHSKSNNPIFYKLQKELIVNYDAKEKLFQAYTNFKNYINQNIDDIKIVYYTSNKKIFLEDFYHQNQEKALELINEINLHFPQKIIDNKGRCTNVEKMNHDYNILNFIFSKIKLSSDSFNHFLVFEGLNFHFVLYNLKEIEKENIYDLYAKELKYNYQRWRS